MAAKQRFWPLFLPKGVRDHRITAFNCRFNIGIFRQDGFKLLIEAISRVAIPALQLFCI
jgi:hypothetical protein